ncbi:uncharacterized protein LOC121368722 [Gigantopelta aegis]|uniref:uncharacterized protein LOC121368722 n=1 Tax=Gigantopelta aegis TaxID=1735272 RepID=UPI001B88D601|nr:uncharacterized protein LOC121368722 [Gigantopelta aegis]
MDDNARPHRSWAVTAHLQNNAVTTLPWPAMSADLNPLEHIWGILGRQIQKMDPPVQNLRELEAALHREWLLLPRQKIRHLTGRVRSRLEAVIRERGGFVLDKKCDVSSKHMPVVAGVNICQCDVSSNICQCDTVFIEERRKQLYPVSKRYKQAGYKSKMVREKLYIDGKLYEDKTPTRADPRSYREVVQTTPRNTRTDRVTAPPPKRSRAASTPTSEKQPSPGPRDNVDSA